MPQPTVAAPQAPTPPAAPASPSVTAIDGSGRIVSAQPITREQAEFLRTRRDALSRQLESATERRDEVAEQLRSENTTAAERPGLEDRLRVLDERLVQLEKDIATNSDQLANAPASRRDGSTAPPGRGGGSPFNVNGNLVVIFSFALLMPFAIQLARRMFAPSVGPSRRELAELAAVQERMNRMESSIDAVAIEMERVGEAQRFLTQAMVGGSLPPGAPAFEGVKMREEQGADLR